MDREDPDVDLQTSLSRTSGQSIPYWDSKGHQNLSGGGEDNLKLKNDQILQLSPLLWEEIHQKSL